MTVDILCTLSQTLGHNKEKKIVHKLAPETAYEERSTRPKNLLCASEQYG